MSDPRIDDFVTAAAEGIASAELRASRTANGYRLKVGETVASALSADELRELARDHWPAVAEWHFWAERAPSRSAHRAFLQWVEQEAEGEPTDRRSALRSAVTRAWGQVHISVRLVDDRRQYALRHVEDSQRAADELRTYDSPAAARDIRTWTDEGQYRPLSTAPTLKTGWVFPALDPETLVRTVDAFYPATVENWYRERTNELDVTHWNAAANRQTGLYEIVDELPSDGVRALAKACCVDSQCLKRRVWDERADEPIDVPAGTGEFPCREPCSLVIAAAREFVKTERERPQTAGPRLRPREQAQLERVVNAVADGEVDTIERGDLTDPANRLRVRYLRERLLESDRWADNGHES